MRKLLFLLLVAGMPSQLLAAGYLQYGERCVPGSTFEDDTGVCEPGCRCYYERENPEFGACIAKCDAVGVEYAHFWVEYGSAAPGYAHRRCADCDIMEDCPTKTQYACTAGYYGTPSSSQMGCQLCPGVESDMGTVAGRSDKGDNADISKCYIYGGISGSDEVGNFTIQGDYEKCYW